jgi:hypothetical protein
MRDFTGGDRDGVVGAEVADPVPGRLDGGVDGVDVVVGASGDRHRLASGGAGDPADGEASEVVVDRAGDDAAVPDRHQAREGCRIAAVVTRPPPTVRGAAAAVAALVDGL